jgi:hypothetical protein
MSEEFPLPLITRIHKVSHRAISQILLNHLHCSLILRSKSIQKRISHPLPADNQTPSTTLGQILQIVFHSGESLPLACSLYLRDPI